MAFAAVVSVEQILRQLILNPADAVPKSAMEPFHVKIRSLQSSLGKMYPVRRSKRDAVKKLESKIRETVYKAQDLIEAFISSHSSQPDFLINLKENEGKLDQILATAEEIVGSMKEEQPAPPAYAEASKSSSRATKSTKIVGQEEDFKTLSKEILSKKRDLQVIPITGLPGIGKTTLARSIFDDNEIGKRFPVRSWVTVGQDFNQGEVFSKLLASVQKRDGSDSATKVKEENAEQLATQLYKSLQDPSKPYLIVVDDVWESGVWDRIRNYLPNKNNCSRILVTTRIDTIAGIVKSGFSYTMKELNDKQSWELLREKVFRGGHCPPNLEVEGRSIAELCGGLPLSITVVGGQLSQELENEKYWKIVKEDIKIAADSDKDTYIEILAQSYEHLPAELKGCFLYLGAFPEDSEIHVSKLVKLWLAEGFLMENGTSSFEDIAEKRLVDLLDRNLISPVKFSSSGKVKTCSMHDSIRHLAESKSGDERFFVSVKKVSSQGSQLHHGEAVAASLKGKHTLRRLSVHKNILMCMENVYESAKLIKPARTLVYAGHYHHHPLPYCLVYDWLRVLDAVRVHFIEFPKQLVKLIHLRYLSLTYNGKLPASLSQLTNLLVLIVRRYPKIIITGKSILPVEIWYMKQLRHILLTECDFPEPPETQAADSPLLENLQSLSAINAANCKEEFFKNVPNLKKLGVWIEAPGAVSLYLDHLPDLEAFKFRVLNPIFSKKIDLQRDLIFPNKLKKLSLSGCGLPWESLNNIGKFPSLLVLKLRHFAFQGSDWIPVKEQFPNLELLLIECLDLEYMEIGFSCCRKLKSLIIKNCYKLKEINEDELTDIGTLTSVKLIGCNHQFVEQVTEIKNKLDDNGQKLQFGVHSSWGKDNITKWYASLCFQTSY